MNWLKENWFKAGILIIGIGIFSLLLSNDLNVEREIKIISAVEYKELNEECGRYGLNKEGDYYEFSGNQYVLREYKYSIPLDTCVMRRERSNIDDILGEQSRLELIDIYLRKPIIYFYPNCEDKDGSLVKCVTRDDFIKEEARIWGNSI